MNKKEFLSQPYKLQKRIDLGIEQAERFRSLAENGHAPSLGGGGGGGGASHSFVETQTIRYMAIKEEIEKNTAKLIKLSSVIKNAIYNINNLEVEYILEARYLNFKDWQRISDDLEISKNYVYRLHKKGLDLIKIPECFGQEEEKEK